MGNNLENSGPEESTPAESEKVEVAEGKQPGEVKDPGAFGLEPPKPNKDSKPVDGDSKDNPEAKESKADPKAPDNPEDGTTPKDTGPDGDKQTPEKLYAKKYKTVEDLEAGYENSTKEFQKLKADLDDKSSKLTILENQFGEMLSTEGGYDEVMEKLNKDHPELVEAYEEIMDTVGKPGAEAFKSFFKALYTKFMDQEGRIKQAEVEQKQAEMEAHFIESHPELESDKDLRGAYEATVKDITVGEKANDPLFLMELMLNAAKGKSIEAKLEDEVNKRAKKLANKLLKEKIASGALSGGTPTGGMTQTGDKYTPEQIESRKSFGLPVD